MIPPSIDKGDRMQHFLDTATNFFQGTDTFVWFAALGAILLGFMAQKIAVLLLNRLLKLTSKTAFQLDDILIGSLSKPISWAIVLGGMYAAVLILPIPKDPPDVQEFFDSLIGGLWMVIAVWAIIRLTDGFSDFFTEKASHTDTKLDDQIIPILRKTIKTFVILAGVVFVLQNLGYSVGSLLAGFGIGGMALALASKDTVSNLFGSIVIFVDRPFQIGDTIDVEKFRGKVEEVGLRTTKIRTYEDCIVSIPNAIFTTKPVQNRQMRRKRWIILKLGVKYSTSPDLLDKTITAIEKLINDSEGLREDYQLVNVHEFTESAVVLQVWVYSVSTNKLEYMKVRHKFLTDIMRLFKELGVEFAFPSRSIYMEEKPEDFDA
jgi:MscS family membrane protein